MVYLAEWLQLLVEMCYFVVSAMVSLLMKYYGACPSQCIKVNYFKGIDKGTRRFASFVSDVSAIRDDRSIFCPGFSNEEINDIIRYLCTS